MARLRVFVSSTYYDLKHLRASLEEFIDGFGYDAVLSEQGGVTYIPDVSLDESCYREIANCDIVVLIIGGRYGSAASKQQSNPSSAEEKFWQDFESVTAAEHKSAVDKGIPVYVFVERPVHAMYTLYTENRANTTIKYPGIESIGIFKFLDRIYQVVGSNPVQPFERYPEIESWLKEQWSGLFRDLLKRRSAFQEIASLSTQVTALSDLNQTFRTYLEALLTKLDPDEGTELVQKESDRLAEVKKRAALQGRLIGYLSRILHMPREEVLDLLLDVSEPPQLLEKMLAAVDGEATKSPERLQDAYDNSDFRKDVNAIRVLLGKPTLWPEVPDNIFEADLREKLEESMATQLSATPNPKPSRKAAAEGKKK